MRWDWEKLKQDHEDKQREGNSKKEKKKFKFPPWMIYTSIFFLWIILAIIFWNAARWLNYKLSYEGKIQEKVIEMVKPESLKEKYRREQNETRNILKRKL